MIGLHSSFEHPAANSPDTLTAYLQEWRIRFPVAIDARGAGDLPRTMDDWGLQGTPTQVLLDRQGRMRARHVGHVVDLALGADIMTLLLETEDWAPQGRPTPTPAPSARSDREPGTAPATADLWARE